MDSSNAHQNAPALAKNETNQSATSTQVKKDILTAIASETSRSATAAHNYNKMTHEKDSPV